MKEPNLIPAEHIAHERMRNDKIAALQAENAELKAALTEARSHREHYSTCPPTFEAELNNEDRDVSGGSKV